MSANVNSNSISAIMQILKESRTHYDEVKDEKQLGTAFHSSGPALNIIWRVLWAAEKALQSGNELSGKSKDSLNACGEKARVSKSVFYAVAQKPVKSRLESYGAVVQQVNEGAGVETLVVKMIECVCTLAEDNALKGSMKGDVKTLQDVKEELSKMMEPTKPNPQQNIFNSAGQSKQFNNVGGGAQYNNTAGGNQLHGSSFHQPVYFGRSS